MPTAPGAAIRDIVRICGVAGVAARTIPGIYELLDGSVSVKQVRNVRIEDLLRREPVKTDTSAVRAMLRDKRVLVTGGACPERCRRGGSIGAELCRQILACRPARLVVLGHGENSIFEIYNELKVEGSKLNVQPSNLQPPTSNLQSPTSNLQSPTSNLQPSTSARRCLS